MEKGSNKITQRTSMSWAFLAKQRTILIQENCWRFFGWSDIQSMMVVHFFLVVQSLMMVLLGGAGCWWSRVWFCSWWQVGGSSWCQKWFFCNFTKVEPNTRWEKKNKNQFSHIFSLFSSENSKYLILFDCVSPTCVTQSVILRARVLDTAFGASLKFSLFFYNPRHPNILNACPPSPKPNTQTEQALSLSKVYQ